MWLRLLAMGRTGNRAVSCLLAFLRSAYTFLVGSLWVLYLAEGAVTTIYSDGKRRGNIIIYAHKPIRTAYIAVVLIRKELRAGETLAELYFYTAFDIEKALVADEGADFVPAHRAGE